MPRKLGQLSTKEIVKIVDSFGFEVTKQRGGHIKMSRVNDIGEKEVLAIPNHSELARGTCKAILNQAAHYIPKEKLVPYFYTDS